MKRQYISPEIHVHGLVIESVLAAGTVTQPTIKVNREGGWGKSIETTKPDYCEERVNGVTFDDGQKTIDVWSGNNVSTF